MLLNTCYNRRNQVKIMSRNTFYCKYFKLILVLPIIYLIGIAQLHSQNSYYDARQIRGYAGLGVGIPDMQSGIESPIGGTEIERSVHSFRAFAGVMFTDWLALEANFNDLGSDAAVAAKLSDAATYLNKQYSFAPNGRMDAKAYSVGIAPVISLNLPYVRPFVRVGYHWWNYKFKASGVFINGVSSEFSRNKRGGDITFGAGMDFKLFPNQWLRFQYDSIPIDSRRSSLTSVNLLTLF